MVERKRVIRKVVITEDISDTGLSKEEFDIVSEHYSNNENIIENKDSTLRRVSPETNDDVTMHVIEESIVATLSKHNDLNPRIVRKLLTEYENIKERQKVL